MLDPRGDIVAGIYPQDVFPANAPHNVFKIQDLPETHSKAIIQITTAILHEPRTWCFLAQLFDGLPCEDSVVGNRLYHKTILGRRMPSQKAWDGVSARINPIDFDALELDPGVCLLSSSFS